MRIAPPLLVALPLALATACAPGGPATPPPLAWDLPGETSVRYLMGDTARMDLELGGERFDARIRSAATLGATFSPSEDGIRVSLAVEELDGRLSQPMGAPVIADESGVQGPLAFSVDRTGRVRDVAPPELSGGAESLLEPLGIAHSFLPRLPGRGAEPGDSWTDTLRYEGETGAGTVRTVAVMTYTLEGDTMLAGRRVARISSGGTVETSSGGTVAGMSMRQTASGDVEGAYLVDPSRGLLVESRESADLRGRLQVSAAPAPLSLRLRRETVLRLAEGG